MGINGKKITNGKSVDLMLIVSPVNLLYRWMPLYYLYLAGYLEKYGFNVCIVEPHFRIGRLSQLDDAKNIKFILNEVKEKNPKFIGFASFVTDYDVVLDLAKQVRKISNAITLIGNAQPSISPEDYVFEGSPFDIVVRGEGELTTKEILESVKSKEDFDIPFNSFFLCLEMENLCVSFLISCKNKSSEDFF